jgi:hypothetical protein
MLKKMEYRVELRQVDVCFSIFLDIQKKLDWESPEVEALVKVEVERCLSSSLDEEYNSLNLEKLKDAMVYPRTSTDVELDREIVAPESWEIIDTYEV